MSGYKTIIIPSIISSVMVVLLLLFAIFHPIKDEDPEPLYSSDTNIGTFEPGEYVDSLASDKYAVIFLLIDGSEITKIAVDSVYAVGYDTYYVHVHGDPKDVRTKLNQSDIIKIFYIKRGTR